MFIMNIRLVIHTQGESWVNFAYIGNTYHTTISFTTGTAQNYNTEKEISLRGSYYLTIEHVYGNLKMWSSDLFWMCFNLKLKII